MNIETTLAERGERYGDFAINARIAQAIKGALRNGPTWEALGDSQKQALDVIADKASRIVTGDATYTDNWHDIQGYARLAENNLAEDAADYAPPASPARGRRK